MLRGWRLYLEGPNINVSGFQRPQVCGSSKGATDQIVRWVRGGAVLLVVDPLPLRPLSPSAFLLKRLLAVGCLLKVKGN